MARERPPDHISRKRVLYSMPGQDAVTVRRDVPYAGDDDSAVMAAGARTLDVYYPPAVTAETRLPAVILVTGFPDDGARRLLGCRFKEMASFVSWAELIAASGMIGITYTNITPGDVQTVLRHVRENAASLGIDSERLGIWACSGHVPNALALLLEQGSVFCGAALWYGYTLDMEDSTIIAEVSKKFGFTDACAGKRVEDLPPGVPLFIVRAGEDKMPGLNAALDLFVTRALALNLPVTIVNHPAAPHAFDISDASDLTREIIRQTLQFLQFRLRSRE